ncbi:uncharacterized protein LOC120628802 [Pararge aegeria]|uniref:uncharacterized protein LOC120628802 n=1 Tax=Pararge aegeria TaxID=116150 RepID=UPI0019D0409B|nr:uncharacterized protein LOC120628802 [Pararge aegeria]
MDNFDTELFIDEIEKRVAIWDMESSDYSNRVIKRRNWEEIVEIFCEPGDSQEKKKALGISLQKKWKGLRDGFVREMKKMKTTPSGSGASSKAKYIYFERLMFLERSTRNKATESNINTTSVTAEEQEFSGDGEDVMRPPLSQVKKKKKLNAADEEFLAIINKNLTSRNQPQTSNQMESDDDKLFCMSLHKELIKIPEENRLQTKIELMKVLQAQQTMYDKPSAVRSAYQPSTQYHYQVGLTQRGQRDYFEETGYNTTESLTSSLSPATYNRGYFTTPRNTLAQNTLPTTPSPASTQDSQESELMELYNN